MSPSSTIDNSISGVPIFASTPLVARPLTNGHDAVDNKSGGENNNDTVGTVNGNVNVTIVSESVNSMDVLSGGESDAGDTLSRRNNNSISSGMLGTLREVSDAPKKRNMDITYFVAKELLMTERTYKRDLELVTVKWSSSVSELAAGGAEAGAALARACLALEPLALSTGKLLARLDRLLASTPKSEELAAGGAEAGAALARACLALEPLALSTGKLLARLNRLLASTPKSEELAAGGAEAGAALARACLALEPLALSTGKLLARLDRLLASTPKSEDADEPEYKKIANVLYEHLLSTIDAYLWYSARAGSLVGVVESVRRRGHAAGRAAQQFDAHAPLPLAALLLRPLHRALHYKRLAQELFNSTQSECAAAALELAEHVASEAREQLQHGENHAALCQLQRDIAGYDKLLVAEREFIRMGCVYKHSSRGLQQRMLFLFSDVLVVTSKAGSLQFRAHAALPLHALELKPSELPHSFTLTGEDVNLLLSATNDNEYTGWYNTLQASIDNARDKFTDVDTELTPYEQETESVSGVCNASGGLAHVCWHRFTSLDTTHLHLAMRTQLSGYLLRKFKKSPGWQKLWVVFAVSTLFFYKSWQDETPLASLPLLGYSVGAPASDDNIDKDFVFKLQFKNHVYFFRADSHYTFNRWTEVLQTATMRPERNSM